MSDTHGSDATIVWADPPPRRAEPGKYDDFAAALKSNPGRWALLGEKFPSTVGAIGKGKIAAFRPAGAFEAAARWETVEQGRTGRANVYVRYVGEAVQS